MSYVNTHKMMTAAEDFMNQMYKIAFMWIPVSLLLQPPFSVPSGFMNKMIVVAGIEILHGCSNHGLCVVWPLETHIWVCQEIPHHPVEMVYVRLGLDRSWRHSCMKCPRSPFVLLHTWRPHQWFYGEFCMYSWLMKKNVPIINGSAWYPGTTQKWTLLYSTPLQEITEGQ